MKLISGLYFTKISSVFSFSKNSFTQYTKNDVFLAILLTGVAFHNIPPTISH